MTKKYLRWHVIAFYRSSLGNLDFHHYIEELVELYDLIEGGPDWDTLDRIEIRLANQKEKLVIDVSDT